MNNLITISATLLTASLASGFTLQPTSPSGPRGLTSAQLASSGSVMEPLPLLPATKQYRGATVRANTDQVGLVSQHPLHICICKMGLILGLMSQIFTRLFCLCRWKVGNTSKFWINEDKVNINRLHKDMFFWGEGGEDSVKTLSERIQKPFLYWVKNRIVLCAKRVLKELLSWRVNQICFSFFDSNSLILEGEVNQGYLLISNSTNRQKLTTAVWLKDTWLTGTLVRLQPPSMWQDDQM